MVDRVQILDAVKAAMEAAPERKFQESIEISVNLRNIDMSQPKNRIDETMILPQAQVSHKRSVCLGKEISPLRRKLQV